MLAEESSEEATGIATGDTFPVVVTTGSPRDGVVGVDLVDQVVVKDRGVQVRTSGSGKNQNGSESDKEFH